MNEPEEKRKCRRTNTAEILKVFDLNTGDCLGNLVNISPAGIMLVTHLRIEANSIYQFSIRFPNESFYPPITFGGEILWTDDRTDPNRTWAGVQIIDISDEMINRIRELVSES